MATDRRGKDIYWLALDKDFKSEKVEDASLCVLMDIRDELKKLNRVFECSNFLDIPRKLDRIDRNTKKAKRNKKVKA